MSEPISSLDAVQKAEVGAILTGKITGITNFGIFVTLSDNTSGLVHISEVSHSFVTNIADVYSVGDEVKVKVLAKDEKGKWSFSIKQSEPKPEGDNSANSYRPGSNFKKGKPKKEELSDFEKMMNKFLKNSEENLRDAKRNSESKRN
ncbi:MAG: S1 RNA-binding domain-containing protein [Clostridiales bacterium]|nr:S1 RNA-binding domain-containing protein [Clostridiales bacterium]